MSFFDKIFGEVNLDNYIDDISVLKQYFNTIYNNKDNLGIRIIRIAPSVFEYGAGSGSLEGHLGMGSFLAVAGIDGCNDALATELGGKAKYMGKHNYYQFIRSKKLSKREMLAILKKLRDIIKEEHIELSIEMDEKLPGLYLYI